MCYKRHPVQTGYLCLSQRSTEAPYPLYPSLHQSMLKSKSSNLKMWLKHNYIRSGIFNVAVYLFVCKASPLFLCLNLKCRVCTRLFVSVRLRRDGNEVAVIICHKMAFHKSTTHPQLNNRLLIIFCDKHKYIQNIPELHKMASHNSRLFINYFTSANA